LLLDAVKNGQADCLLNDSSAVAGQAAGYPKGTFKIMPELLAKEPLAYATRYDSLDLLTWINLFIDQTTLDGRLQKTSTTGSTRHSGKKPTRHLI
jgi:polar amino acid transport system substrate-binding protein